MSCENCTPAKTLRTCGGILEIEAVAIDSYFFVFATDITTGATYYQQVLSDHNGLVEFDLDARERFWQPNHTYNIWLQPTSAEDMDSKATITINATEYECFQVTFIAPTGDEKQAMTYSFVQKITPTA